VLIQVNGVRLFVEVLGPKLVPDGPRMRERPTVVALHGGPSDHAQQPVLILGGDEDPIMPPSFQDELEAALTSAPVRRIRFEKAGHFLQLDAPEAYFAALREFVV
jgi:predicted esterase